MLNEQWLIIFLIEFMNTFFKSSRAQHIVPCTISQLLSATLVDEVFRIGNVEISQVWKVQESLNMKNEIKLTSFKNI